ncbi:helix-turn-helix domain-containing protein [Nocardia sp. NPDC003183]
MSIAYQTKQMSAAQAFLKRTAGDHGPYIQMRPDGSLYIEYEGATLETTIVTEGKATTVYCAGPSGCRLYFHSITDDPDAALVQKKPAGECAWTYSRWRQGTQELECTDHHRAVYGPGLNDEKLDEKLLRRLWYTPAVADDELARRLGCELRSAIRWAYHLDLPQPRYKAQQMRCNPALVQELWNDASLTKKSIAKRLEISEADLSKVAKSLDLPARKPIRKDVIGGFTGSPPERGDNDALQSSTIDLLGRTYAALQLPKDAVPSSLRTAGDLRLRHPHASLSELAEVAGCTKDTMAGRLRRLCALVA